MFKKYSEFIQESVIITLDKTMKNEFMNDYILKSDFENAKREFYMNGGFLFTHISKDEFELRSQTKITSKDLDEILRLHVNTATDKLKFSVKKGPKKDIIKEYTWIIKGEIN
jgi:predicted HTH transcriptional regulator